MILPTLFWRRFPPYPRGAHREGNPVCCLRQSSFIRWNSMQDAQPADETSVPAEPAPSAENSTAETAPAVVPAVASLDSLKLEAT